MAWRVKRVDKFIITKLTMLPSKYSWCRYFAISNIGLKRRWKKKEKNWFFSLLAIFFNNFQFVHQCVFFQLRRALSCSLLKLLIVSSVMLSLSDLDGCEMCVSMENFDFRFSFLFVIKSDMENFPLSLSIFVIFVEFRVCKHIKLRLWSSGENEIISHIEDFDHLGLTTAESHHRSLLQLSTVLKC